MNPSLTPRESQIVRAIAVECLPVKAAARRLGISDRTVERHKTTIYEKLGITNIAELARMMAIQECEGRS